MFNYPHSETYRRLAHLSPLTQKNILKMAIAMNEIKASQGGCADADLRAEGFTAGFIRDWSDKARDIAGEILEHKAGEDHVSR